VSRRRLVAIIIGAVALVGGCAGAEPAPLTGLTPFGGTWHVLAIDDEVIEERGRAPSLQFQVRGALEVVTQCGRYEFRLTSLSETTLSVGAPTQVGTGESCDATARTIEAELLHVLDRVETFTDGRPDDRLALLGLNGRVLLAQPAANPTS
jgi:hypothetical protein